MTTPTTDPVPSLLPQNLLFNTEKLDEMLNSDELVFTDRNGVERPTAKGIAEGLAAPAVESATYQNKVATEIALAQTVDARDTVLAFKGIFASTAAGIVATTNGQGFGVPSAGAGFADLFTNNSGVAQATGKTLPSVQSYIALQNTFATEVGGDIVPFNTDFALENGAPDDGWIAYAPPSGAVIDCNIPKVVDMFNIRKWVKFLAGVGYADGATTNNVYFAVDYGAPIPAGKVVQIALVVHRPTGADAYPSFDRRLLWDPVASSYAPWSELVIDDTTKVMWANITVGSEGSTKVLIGSEYGIQPNDFYIGGWACAFFDYNPVGLRIDMFKRSVRAIARSLMDHALTKERAVFLGDSITYGAGSSTGNTSWADRLNARVGFTSYTKLAANGATVKPTVDRYKLSDQVAAIPSGSTLIVIPIGVNDELVGNTLGDVATVMGKTYASLDQTVSFAEAWRFNLETVKRNFPDARVVVSLPLNHALGGYLNTNAPLYRNVQRAICGYFGVPVIEAWSDSGIWAYGTDLPDNLHPGDDAYDRLSWFFERRLIST